MPQTLYMYMLGNGFDLAHDLPTKYRDFFYFVEAIKRLASGPVDLSTIPIFQENLSQHTLEYLTDCFRSYDIPDYIKAIQLALCFNTPEHENLWHSLFRKKLNEKSRLDTWIDFEKEIENEIKVFRSILFPDTPSFSLTSSPVEMMKRIYRAMGSYSFTPSKRSPPEEKLSDYEYEISSAIACSRDTSSLISNYLKECILFLYHELQRYIFCLELYLRFYVTEHCLPSYGNNLFLSELFTHQVPNFILSFNYTETYKDYIQRYQSHNIGVQHIHGRLRSKDHLDNAIQTKDYLHSPLVLGFHNHEKFESSDDIQFLWFEKFFQRMLCKTGTDFFTWIDNKIPKNSRQLHTIIYGHSLDKTDGDSIRLIFERSSKITVYYYQETDLPQLISNLILVFDRNQVNYYYTMGILEFRPILQST